MVPSAGEDAEPGTKARCRTPGKHASGGRPTRSGTGSPIPTASLGWFLAGYSAIDSVDNEQVTGLSNRLHAWCVGGTAAPGVSGAGLSRGARALNLLYQQRTWTHRRVEVVSYLPSGGTRRRISWDFTIPSSLAIPVGKDRLAVPLATLQKAPLKHLDVTDNAGNALPVWGTNDNGELAYEALLSGLDGIRGVDPTNRIKRLIRSVVFDGSESAEASITALLALLPTADESVVVLEAVARDLAANFMFVVELPVEIVDVRTLVKVAYQDDLGGKTAGPFSIKHKSTIVGDSWPAAESWHLEVHAPHGLAISELSFESWDPDDKIVDSGVSNDLGHTAHVTGRVPSDASASQAELVLRPAAAGLVNQSLLGAWLAYGLLALGFFTQDQVFDATRQPDQAGAIAAVTLAVPAFLVALLSRSPEHGLVSRLLLAPRLIAGLTSLVLLAAATALVFRLSHHNLDTVTQTLWATQAALLLWATRIRFGSVGGRP
jgi:hypothetical protein